MEYKERIYILTMGEKSHAGERAGKDRELFPETNFSGRGNTIEGVKFN